LTKAKNDKSSNSERVEPCDKDLTKQFEEDLLGFILEPSRLDKLTISQLKALLDKAHNKRTLSNSMKSSSYQPSQKPYKQKGEIFKDDLANIGPKIKFVIDKKLRKKEYVYCRYLSMYFMRIITSEVFKKPEITLHWIGKRYEKDHATVLHAMKTVKDLIDTDKQTSYIVAFCLNRIMVEINKENTSFHNHKWYTYLYPKFDLY